MKNQNIFLKSTKYPLSLSIIIIFSIAFICQVNTINMGEFLTSSHNPHQDNQHSTHSCCQEEIIAVPINLTISTNSLSDNRGNQKFLSLSNNNIRYQDPLNLSKPKNNSLNSGEYLFNPQTQLLTVVKRE